LLLKVKAKVEGRLNAIAGRLSKLGLTPNQLTVIGLCLSFIAAYFYASTPPLWYIWVATVFLALSGLLDALDGAMARGGGRVTAFGGFLDSVTDRYADVVVIFGITLASAEFVLVGVNGYVWGLLAVIGSMMVSYTRARAEGLGVKLASVGVAERPERLLILLIFSIILRPEWGVVIVAVLANVTAVQRAVHVYRKLKSGRSSSN
jgi:archaetidylinositol phosphate synthase